MKRLLWADLIRTLAIYLVLVDHSSHLPKYIYNYSFDTRIVSFAIATTCVPLFVMLSGATLLHKKESYKNFFKKRFLRLFFPWTIWSAIYTVIYGQNLTSPTNILRAYLTQFEGFWFLPMIAGLYLFTPAIRIFVSSAKKYDIWLMVILWFLFVSLFPYTRNSLMFPQHVDNGILRQIINYSGYFILGYLLVKTKFKKLLIKSLICIGTGLLSTVIATYLSSLHDKGILVKDFFNYIAPGTILLASGIFMIFMIIGKTLEQRISELARHILFMMSTSALAIYFIHELVQATFAIFFKQVNLATSIPFDNLINGAILFIISFCILSIIFKIPFAKRLLA